MFYKIRNNAEVSALCAGAGWAASAQLSSCGGCGHLQWRLRLEEAGRSNHVEWNASLTINIVGRYL